MTPTTAPPWRSGTCSMLHSGVAGESTQASPPSTGAVLRRRLWPCASIGQWAQSVKGRDCPRVPSRRPALATQCRPCACSSSTHAPSPPVACRAAFVERWKRSSSLRACEWICCCTSISTACVWASCAASTASAWSVGLACVNVAGTASESTGWAVDVGIKGARPHPTGSPNQ